MSENAPLLTLSVAPGEPHEPHRKRCLPMLGRASATLMGLHSVKLLACRLGSSAASTNNKVLQYNPQRRYQVLQRASDARKREERRKKTVQKIQRFLGNTTTAEHAAYSLDDEELPSETNSSTDSSFDSANSFRCLLMCGSGNSSNDYSPEDADRSWRSAQNERQSAEPANCTSIVVEDTGEAWEASFAPDEAPGNQDEGDHQEGAIETTTETETEEEGLDTAEHESADEHVYDNNNDTAVISTGGIPGDVPPTTTRTTRAARGYVMPRPRPKLRLNLAKRGNWKFVRGKKEVEEWHQEMQKVTKSKRAREEQRKTLHTLRKTCQILEKPLRRGFVDYMESTREEIMFSAIYEEQLEDAVEEGVETVARPTPVEVDVDDLADEMGATPHEEGEEVEALAESCLGGTIKQSTSATEADAGTNVPRRPEPDAPLEQVDQQEEGEVDVDACNAYMEENHHEEGVPVDEPSEEEFKAQVHSAVVSPSSEPPTSGDVCEDEDGEPRVEPSDTVKESGVEPLSAEQPTKADEEEEDDDDDDAATAAETFESSSSSSAADDEEASICSSSTGSVYFDDEDCDEGVPVEGPSSSLDDEFAEAYESLSTTSESEEEEEESTECSWASAVEVEA